ncbi:hypothetical protein EII29_09805 [Leptotrichia sp. OH3620_COT-345]|uniref:phage virion morphogenesis protein n=1 Tax=Leptotrichia sp. OH3620_COT-345 TaxID=2491048 RepID=UPI000F648370|nr:phage virion morphogenesis protein [Leptotrichia sp. OH3620_COT-345]RRD38810.1 hypothetical protein EII29_09805 [Leptotrichia sp. OH3620_COT-345]
MKIKNNINEFVITFQKKLDDIQQENLMDEIGFYMENEMRKRFDRGTDYKGKAWKKLKYRTGKPLRDTGALMGSLGTAEIKGDTVSIFSNLKYARLHDLGGTIEPKNKKMLKFTIGGIEYFSKKINVPARKFSGISNKNKEDIKKTVSDFFLKKLK